MTKKLFAPSAFVLVLVLGVYGCNSPDSGIATPPVPTADINSDHDLSSHDHGDHDDANHDQGAQKTDMEKMTEQSGEFLARGS